MKKNIFFTDSTVFSRRWTDAFPDAQVVDSADKKRCSRVQTGDLCWVLTQSDDWTSRITTLAQTGARIIALTRNESSDEVITALAAGCHGYAHVLAPLETLRSIAMTVQNGGFWVGQSFMQRLLRSTRAIMPPPSSDGGLTHLLTPRETETARLVASGLSNKSVAKHLGVTERTVKAHLSAIYGKLQVQDRLQLALLVKGEQPDN